MQKTIIINDKITDSYVLILIPYNSLFLHCHTTILNAEFSSFSVITGVRWNIIWTCGTDDQGGTYESRRSLYWSWKWLVLCFSFAFLMILFCSFHKKTSYLFSILASGCLKYLLFAQDVWMIFWAWNALSQQQDFLKSACLGHMYSAQNNFSLFTGDTLKKVAHNVLVRCLVIASNHNVKLAGHFQKLFGRTMSSD